MFSCSGSENTALIIAAKHGHLEMVQFLTAECHAVLEAVNGAGVTAVIAAAIGGRADVVRYLVEDCGASAISAKADDRGGPCSSHIGVVQWNGGRRQGARPAL